MWRISIKFDELISIIPDPYFVVECDGFCLLRLICVSAHGTRHTKDENKASTKNGRERERVKKKTIETGMH